MPQRMAVLSIINVLIFFVVVLFLQITRQMKKSLSTLGYTEQDVNQMSPSEAHDVVNRGVRKTAKLHPSSKD